MSPWRRGLLLGGRGRPREEKRRWTCAKRRKCARGLFRSDDRRQSSTCLLRLAYIFPVDLFQPRCSSFFFFFFLSFFFPSFACVHTRRTEILADKMASHAGRVATQSRLHRERARDNRSSRSGGGSIHCVNLSWGWHCLNFFLVSTYPRFFLFFFLSPSSMYLCASRRWKIDNVLRERVFFYSLYLSLSTWGRKGVWDIFAACNARGCFWRIYIYHRFYMWVSTYVSRWCRRDILFDRSSWVFFFLGIITVFVMEYWLFEYRMSWYN